MVIITKCFSMMYQIPKTTLFREKTRLVEAGKLPWNSLKRKDPQSHSVNNVRLKEAVNACKDGKMSQAVASITYQVVAWKPACRAFSLHRASCKTFYQVPKTTIWRRLQKGMQQAAKQEQSDKNITSIAVSNTMDHSSVTESVPVQNQSQFTFIEASTVSIFSVSISITLQYIKLVFYFSRIIVNFPSLTLLKKTFLQHLSLYEILLQS